MDLREWTTVYVKHKDVMVKKLVSTKDEADHILFTYKDGEMKAYPYEVLQVPQIKGKTLICTLQKKDNVDFLIKHWKEFSSHAGLTIVFVNMNTHDKWLIHPHTHAQIAEAKFEPGVRTLADSISYM